MHTGQASLDVDRSEPLVEKFACSAGAGLLKDVQGRSRVVEDGVNEDIEVREAESIRARLVQDGQRGRDDRLECLYTANIM